MADKPASAFDAWLDDSDHNPLLLSIRDDCWQDIAYAAARAAFDAGRAEEREACAQLAIDRDAIWLQCEDPNCDCRDHGGEPFADLIRARTTPQEGTTP